MKSPEAPDDFESRVREAESIIHRQQGLTRPQALGIKALLRIPPEERLRVLSRNAQLEAAMRFVETVENITNAHNHKPFQKPQRKRR